MIPWILLVVTIVFYLYTGWLPYMLHVPVVPGLLAACLVAAWGLLRRRRPHAVLGFPLLAIPTALMLFGPVDVSVSPRARLGVRLVPVAYGLLTDPGPEARGGDRRAPLHRSPEPEALDHPDRVPSSEPRRVGKRAGTGIRSRRN